MLDSSRVTELTQKLSEGVVQKILEKYKKDGFWIENDPGYAHGNYGIITQLIDILYLTHANLMQKLPLFLV